MQSDHELPELAPELLRRLSGVRSVGVITGAGISSESGIRTYRGKGGVYDDPVEGDRTIEALSGPTLRRDPDRTWRQVAELAREAGMAKPNAAHLALVDLERAVERFVLLTQNVDLLHRMAGSENVIAIHGSIDRGRCMTCDLEVAIPDPGAVIVTPRCQVCEGLIRPAVVLFGEMLPMEELRRLRSEFLDRVPELVIVVGTSALFPYIVEPVIAASTLGRLTIEINPEPTALSDMVQVSLRATAGEVLPTLVNAIIGKAIARA